MPATLVRPDYLQGGRAGNGFGDYCTDKPTVRRQWPPEVAMIWFGGRSFALQKKSGE